MHFLLKWVLRVVFPGLGVKRIREWGAVLAEEDRYMTRKDRLLMALEGFKAIWVSPSPKEWRLRMRICAKCPIYDKQLKRCRPFTGSTWGCGCYAPYKALTPGACWAHHRNPQAGWGPKHSLDR